MFYEKVLKLCSERNMSITGLAAELQISSGAPTGWKSGARPRESTVDKIAKFFGVSEEYLLNDAIPIGGNKKPSVPGDEGLADRIALFMSLTPEQQALALEVMRKYVDRTTAKE